MKEENNKKRKIPIKNLDSDLACIFKARLDRFGYSTWQELADKCGIEKGRVFIDFLAGESSLTKEEAEKVFEVLEIPREFIEFYLEPIIKYRVKKAR